MEDSTMKMSITLFDSIINTSQDCVFWKDKDRRFLGVNQAFLDFYGFESEDVLVGKTDEDMNWHSDPEPFRQDELRVLSGESTYKVQGKCMVGDEERDIIASKRPLYEGDEIVGLVGSFMDITDLMRKQRRSESRQIVYTVEGLRKYPFWDRLLDYTSVEEILDPLTGVITRGFMNDFALSLISNGTPFSLSILDLDNFKFINDRYGHTSGDTVLKEVTRALSGYTDGFGLVGRFGGDELLLINLRDTEYEGNLAFWKKLYSEGGVFRRDIPVESGKVFITSTTGSASFPADSAGLKELFALIDKCLYIGKGKGRNCFTVYRKDEHEKIDIKKISKHNLSSDMVLIREILENAPEPEKGLAELMPHLSEVLKIDDLYYTDRNGNFYAVLDKEVKGDGSDAAGYIRKGLCVCNSISEVSSVSPKLFLALEDRNIASFIAAKTGGAGDGRSFIICATDRTHRIWQDSECSLVYYLATVLSSLSARPE